MIICKPSTSPYRLVLGCVGKDGHLSMYTKVYPSVIVIQRVEGSQSESREYVVCDSWQNANRVLGQMRCTAPEDGSYHKTDFWILWSNPEWDVYAGRLDLTRWDMETLNDHVRDHLSMRTGSLQPGGWEEDEYTRWLDQLQALHPGYMFQCLELLNGTDFTTNIVWRDVKIRNTAIERLQRSIELASQARGMRYQALAPLVENGLASGGAMTAVLECSNPLVILDAIKALNNPNDYLSLSHLSLEP